MSAVHIDLCVHTCWVHKFGNFCVFSPVEMTPCRCFILEMVSLLWGRYLHSRSGTKLHQTDCCAFMDESLEVYSMYLCWPWPLTYLCYLSILFWGSIWHYTSLTSYMENFKHLQYIFPVLLWIKYYPETANLEHRLTWKVASLLPNLAHVKSVTKWLPKNALKSWISQKLKMVEQNFKSHNTPHHQSYPQSLVSSL